MPLLRYQRRGVTLAAFLTLLEAAALLAATRLALLLAFKRTMDWAIQRTSGTSTPPPQVQRRIRRTVVAASHLLPWSSLCLPNAIAARLMLARRGYASTLHLGVGKHSDGALHAHAWLETGAGIVVGHQQRHTVTALPSQPGSRP